MRRWPAWQIRIGGIVSVELTIACSLAMPNAAIVTATPSAPAPHRCGWVTPDPLYIDYHDYEWGVPSHDEQHLFEMLNLEGAQAGLSWITILRKRKTYREAFANWDIERIARFGDREVNALLANPGIVRNRLKVAATITNAQAYLRLRERGQTLDQILWSVVDGVTRRNAWPSYRDCPARTPESDALSRLLLGHGFKFVGSTICYALMQATGIVNDHEMDCVAAPENRLLSSR
jgi:DNA-3-methyladenine glycosylase I